MIPRKTRCRCGSLADLATGPYLGLLGGYMCRRSGRRTLFCDL